MESNIIIDSNYFENLCKQTVEDSQRVRLQYILRLGINAIENAKKKGLTKTEVYIRNNNIPRDYLNFVKEAVKPVRVNGSYNEYFNDIIIKFNWGEKSECSLV